MNTHCNWHRIVWFPQNDCHCIKISFAQIRKIIYYIIQNHSAKIIHFRDYKKFSNDAFTSELFIENGNLQNYNDLDSFLAKCKNVLNRTAPLKQKHVRANNSPFINKTILKAIMKRTRLKNKFVKYRCEGNKKPTIHKKTCVFL